MFPDNMAPDTFEYGYQVDIDQRQLNDAINEGDGIAEDEVEEDANENEAAF